jgi:hypothetical protein
MSAISYYKEYLNLKAHFTNKKFNYHENHIPYIVKWNKESESRKEWWNRTSSSMNMIEFRKIVIAHLLKNPKIYFLQINSTADFVISFNKYWSNYLYWFEQEITFLFSGQWVLENFLNGIGHISTFTLLYGIQELQKLQQNDNSLFEYQTRIEKFYLLIKDKIDWEQIKKIKEKYNK